MMAKPIPETGTLTRRAVLSTLAQFTFWPAVALAAVRTRVVARRELHQLPGLKERPARVRPQFNMQEIVSDSQLRETLAKVRLEDKPLLKVNHIDHALRLWGPEIEFDDGDYLGGPEMLRLLTDHRALQSNWGEDVRPLMEWGPHGLRVRIQEGEATSSHVDHTLATLTEIGLPLSLQIRTHQSAASLSDLFRQSLRAFSLNQREYEWTSLALAMYSVDNASWHSSEGQEITFDRLAQRIMREAMGDGVCLGGHRLFTLAMMLRIHDQSHPIFSADVREQVERHLGEATRRLVATQDPDGYWDESWPGYASPRAEQLWPLGAQLVATGHAMEWWAMLSTRTKFLLPPRETLIRAGQWLVRKIETMEPATVQKNFTFLTHAARALSLWRGELAAESWRRLRLADNPDPVDSMTEGLRAFGADQRGAVLSIELVLLATIIVIGVLTGLSTYRDAVVQELGDGASSIGTLTQSFEYAEIERLGSYGAGISEIDFDARVEGSQYVDRTDLGEDSPNAVGQPPMCIVIDATSVGDET